MNLWTALIYGAAVLLATTFFYVLLRWRRSPMAVRGMAFIAGLCFLSGLLTGIWVFHVVNSGTIEIAAPATKPSPAPSAAQASKAATATARPTAQATPRAAPSVAMRDTAPATALPDWLARVNFYRSMAKVRPVAEDAKLSTADLLHARYLVKNRVPPDSRTHDEDPANRWSTPEGWAAARTSDVIAHCAGCAELSPAQAIDMWVAGPFHRVSILNPALSHIGYGDFREGGLKAYAINVGGAFPRAGRFAAPVMFPGKGTVVGLKAFNGEWPDPLAGCPGFRPPSGLPVTLELGPNVETVVEQHSLTEDGRALEHCVFDASTYANPVGSAQQWGRNILKAFGAVVLMPRMPLVAGRRYTVDLLVCGRKYSWSFSIER